MTGCWVHKWEGREEDTPRTAAVSQRSLKPATDCANAQNMCREFYSVSGESRLTCKLGAGIVASLVENFTLAAQVVETPVPFLQCTKRILTSGMQGWLNTHKSIMLFIISSNRKRDYFHSYSKAFNKIWHQFIIKIPNKMVIKGIQYNMEKIIYGKSTVNIIMNNGNLKVHP